MRFLTGRAVAILVAAMIATMAAGAGVAQANDRTVLTAVVAAGHAVGTPAVTKATRKINSNLHSNHITSVVKPLGVVIKAYRKAVSLIKPTHGSSATGKRLKVDALTSFKDSLSGLIALRTGASVYLGHNFALSQQYVRTYKKDNAAAKKALTRALKQEHLLLL
jgi:hypothetical protein